jgi:hypothetical protein
VEKLDLSGAAGYSKGVRKLRFPAAADEAPRASGGLRINVNKIAEKTVIFFKIRVFFGGIIKKNRLLKTGLLNVSIYCGGIRKTKDGMPVLFIF